MTGNRKVFLWIMATLIGAVVAASIALAYPTEVARPALGDGWQCHRSTIVTTCRRISHSEPITGPARTRFTETRRV
jgi:hypothetical protein